MHAKTFTVRLYTLIMLLAGCMISTALLASGTDTTITPAKDSISITQLKATPKKDSVKYQTPGKAALRSAIIPGLGQAYNHKYWKIPVIYGILGTCGGIFAYNFGNYKDTRFAYKVRYNMRVNHTDSALASQIKPKLVPLSEESLRFYRNQYRRDIDYSALVFILLWGLNVVDATVDAHLRSFDVGPDLGFKFKAGYSDMAKTNGVSFIWKIGK
jgi:hypothetical protein